jgi:hypothetical protein
VEPPLAELIHGARISDSVLILLCGIVPVPLDVFARACPVTMFARIGTWAKAFARPAAFVLVAPTWVASIMNGLKAQTEATVVTSSIAMYGYVETKELHVPRAVIMAKAGLSAPLASPGFPPSARIYIWSAPFVQLQSPPMLKPPLESVVAYPFPFMSAVTPVAEVFSRDVAADPFPEVPAAYR